MATIELAEYSACDGAVGLWGKLARRETDLVTGDNLNSSLRELYRLTLHLQSTIAPQLAEKFVKSGYYDEANMALRLLHRTSDELDQSARFQQAELLSALGNVDAAERILLDLSNTNSLEAAHALVRYIDMVSDGGGVLSDTIVELAEVYSVELRDSEIGPRIARAHILALAKSGDFNGAYDVMQSALNLGIDEQSQFSKFFDILSREASDFEFVKRALSATQQEVVGMPATTKFRLASRLNKLGFDERAAELLTDVPASVYPKDQRLLRARVALGLGRYQAAIEFVGSADDSDAKLVLAAAYEMSGDGEKAFQVYSDLGLTEDAEEVIWRSEGDFPAEFEGSQASERLMELANGIDEQVLVGQLAQTQELIVNSKRLSNEIASLLNLPELQN